MAHTTVDGSAIWYEVTGEGPPLVLSGGFGLLENQFDFVREELARDFTLIDWNYRGVGRSDRAWPGRTYTLDRWVDDLEGVLAHLGIAQAFFWGTSTGSQMTMRYCARYPQRVKAMITYPMIMGDVGFRAAFAGFQYVAETFGYEALAALTSWIGVAKENLFEAEWGRMARWEADMFRKNFSIESLAETMAIHAHTDLRADIERIRVPVLVLLGATGNLGAEQPGVQALLEAFRERVPQAATSVIPAGGGTYCMIEKPAETAAAVRDFLLALD